MKKICLSLQLLLLYGFCCLTEVISSDLLKPHYYEYEGSGDEMDLSDIFPISTVPLFPSSVFHTTTLSILESETSILPFSTEIEMFTSIDITLSTFLPVETSSLIYTTPSFIFSTATPSLLMSSSPLPSSPLFSLSSINRDLLSVMLSSFDTSSMFTPSPSTPPEISISASLFTPSPSTPPEISISTSLITPSPSTPPEITFSLISSSLFTPSPFIPPEITFSSISSSLFAPSPSTPPEITFSSISSSLFTPSPSTRPEITFSSISSSLFTPSPSSVPDITFSSTSTTSSSTSGTRISTSTISVTPMVTPTSRIPVVMVMTLNATALRITWSPVSEASGYVIYISEDRNGLSKGKRQSNERIIYIIGGQVTSHVISDLKAFTSYSVTVATVDQEGNVGPRSTAIEMLTGEAAPGPPRNVTWVFIGNNELNVSWLPPEFPNGIITSYVVTFLFSNDYQTQHIVNGNESMLIVTRPSLDFSITVFAVNGAGESSPQNGTMIIVEDEVSGDRTLSSGAIAGIVIVCVILLLLIISALVVLLILRWRRWYHSGGADIDVEGEMEYKAVGSGDFDDTDSQLTAKRWMRANANYSTPSLLLPPISELIHRYSTVEDVIEAKTIYRPQVNGLDSIVESPLSPKELPPSTSSSSERSRETPSTLSSVCSRTRLEVNKVVQPVLPDESVRERDSRIETDDQPLFEMMENVYMANPLEIDSLKHLEIESSVLDIREHVGMGESTKVMRALTSSFGSENEVAVKILNEEAGSRSKETFLGAAYIMSQFSHPNVLSLFGVCITTPPLITVLTFMNVGDLKHFLTRVRRRTRLESQPCDFGLKDQLNISAQIAGGMEYLASKFFVHKALQAKYILLNEAHAIKIGGFRASHALSVPGGYIELKMNSKLPAKWLSIETLTAGKFSSNTDIWSFGVVLWEIFAYGLTPFRGVQNDDILQHLKAGKRLIKPSDCPDDIYTVMLHCWNENSRERPSFNFLHKHLTTVLESISKERETVRDEYGNLTRTSEVEIHVDTSDLINIPPVQIYSSETETLTTQQSSEGGNNPPSTVELSLQNANSLSNQVDNMDVSSVTRTNNNCDLVLTVTNSETYSEVELSNTDREYMASLSNYPDGESNITNENYTKL